METLRAQAHSSLLPKHSPSKWMLDGKKVRLTEGKHDLGMAETLLHEQRPKPRRRGTLLAKGKPEHRITPGGSFKSTEKAAKQGLQKHSPVPFLGQVNTQDSTEPQSMPGEQRPGHWLCQDQRDAKQPLCQLVLGLNWDKGTNCCRLNSASRSTWIRDWIKGEWREIQTTRINLWVTSAVTPKVVFLLFPRTAVSRYAQQLECKRLECNLWSALWRQGMRGTAGQYLLLLFYITRSTVHQWFTFLGHLSSQKITEACC